METNNLNTYTNSNEPLLISVKEACELTHIGRNTMLKLAKMKGFPALILPHKILIDKLGLPTWLRKNYGKYKGWWVDFYSIIV